MNKHKVPFISKDSFLIYSCCVRVTWCAYTHGDRRATVRWRQHLSCVFRSPTQVPRPLAWASDCFCDLHIEVILLFLSKSPVQMKASASHLQLYIKLLFISFCSLGDIIQALQEVDIPGETQSSAMWCTCQVKGELWSRASRLLSFSILSKETPNSGKTTAFTPAGPREHQLLVTQRPICAISCDCVHATSFTKPPTVTLWPLSLSIK